MSAIQFFLESRHKYTPHLLKKILDLLTPALCLATTFSVDTLRTASEQHLQSPGFSFKNGLCSPTFCFLITTGMLYIYYKFYDFVIEISIKKMNSFRIVAATGQWLFTKCWTWCGWKRYICPVFEGISPCKCLFFISRNCIVRSFFLLLCFFWHLFVVVAVFVFMVVR